jgi:negative regulator of sigma-B (phosphoserine phosphatase)
MAAMIRAPLDVAPSALVDWGLAERPRPGGAESGDRHVVQPFASGVLLAVVDGLGHGEPAAAAARLAAAILAEHAEEPLSLLVERCHTSLAHTRGVVMSLASISTRDHTMSWLGVGNVEAVLLRRERREGGSGGTGESPQLEERARDSLPRERKMEQLLLRPGVVGQKLPVLQPALLRVEPGDTLVLATDGIRRGFTAALTPAGSPRQLADGILAGHGRDDDDALVLVARLQGAAA